MTQVELENLVLEQGKLIGELQEQIKALANKATIPFEVGEAIKARVLADAGVALHSTKLSTSEDTSALVSTGPNVYASVLNTPDGFLEISITGVKYFIPYYL